MVSDSQRYKESFVSAFSFGVFLILLGAIFIVTPNFFDKLSAFFMDFDIVQAPNLGIYFPAPKNPASHMAVYSAASQFCLAWGIFLIALLCFRIFAHAPLHKKAENFSDIVVWLGGAVLIISFLNEGATASAWFAFWALVITLIGVSLIVRALVLAAFRPRKVR
ncbi:MAG: hypothetical protein ACPLZC_05205 [Candidatus Bathyarchaeales archaeon]